MSSATAPLTPDQRAQLIAELRWGRAQLEAGEVSAYRQRWMLDRMAHLGCAGPMRMALQQTLAATPPEPWEGGRRDLPEVGIVAVDCAHPALAARALQVSLARCNFADALLLTDRAVDCPGARVERIASLSDAGAYSRFMLKDLLAHVRTEFVLVVQWDGYVLDPGAWREEFLLFDYIGALWPHIDPPHNMGNGGFSLRSRALLEALQDPAFSVMHPEDHAICRRDRAALESRHGMAFASSAVAGGFAYEYTEPAPAFGFHGVHNLPWVAGAPEVRLLRFLDPLIEQCAAQTGQG